MILPRRKAYIQSGEFKLINNYKKNLALSSIDAIQEWQKHFAKYIDRKYAFAVNSGRIGMKIIFESMNLKPRSEVIIPAYTLKDLIPIIQELDLIPVPADVDPETFNICPELIKCRISKNTRAILATHLFGNPCPMFEIMELAKKYSINVIEDCAHSVGSTINGKNTGTFGHAAFFSFEAIKPINTYGGGMIVTNDKSIAEYTNRLLANYQVEASVMNKLLKALFERFLFSSSLAHPFLYLLSNPSWKRKMTSLYRWFQKPPKEQIRYSEIQALIGLNKIKTLNARIKRRHERSEYLLNVFLNDHIKFQKILPGYSTNYYFLVGLTQSNPAELRRYLLKNKIDAGIEDEIADDCAIQLGYKDCLNVKNIYNKAIHLPLYEDMTDIHIEKIGNVIKQYYAIK